MNIQTFKNINLIPLVIFAFLAFDAYSQDDPYCGTDDFVNLYPSYQSDPIIHPQSYQKSTDGDIIIPVVVHVLHNFGTENISDEQIYDEIARTNMQLQGGEGGDDSQIELRMAKKDPDGNCTNGIVRIQNDTPNVNPFDTENCPDPLAISDSELKSLSVWDQSKYLNVWIVKDIRYRDFSEPCAHHSANVAGYSFWPMSFWTPDNLPSWDGIVLEHSRFGTIGTAESEGFNGIRNTFVHELGHYLGLRHPWGQDPLPDSFEEQCDFNCAVGEDYDCTNSGDFVCDTNPTKSGYVQSLDYFCQQNSSCGQCDGIDQDQYQESFDNYVSYKHLCQSRYTPDQIVRMQYHLEQYRYSLCEQSNLVFTGVLIDGVQPLQVEVISVNDNNCAGVNFGSANIEVSGGVPPYDFLWSTGATTEDIFGLATGYYSVTVADSDPICRSYGAASVEITEPILQVQTFGACIGTNTGAAELILVNGDPNNYEVEWSTGDTGWESPDFFIGNYSVELTSDNCTIEETFMINNGAPAQMSVTDSPIACGEDGYLMANVYSDEYEVLYEWFDSDGNLVGTEAMLYGVPEGEYTVDIQLVGSCNATLSGELETNFIVSNPDLLVVDQNMTIDEDLRFGEGIIVASGATLTVNDCLLEFDEFAGITVQPGGVLKVNDATLSSYCYKTWLGIEVLGTPGEYQGPNPQASSPHHGLARLLSGTVIENATLGVTNAQRNDNIGGPIMGGGKIYTNGAEFRNCNEAVRLAKFSNQNNGNHYDIQANFIDTKFDWDEYLPFTSFQPMIRMHGVRGVDLEGCQFTNTNESLFIGQNNSHVYAAIYMDKATIDMTENCSQYDGDGNCISGVASSIEGFNYGIVNFSKSASSVTRTNFRNYRSIYMFKNKQSRITENFFSNLPPDLEELAGLENENDPIWQAHYGVYLEYSTGFWVEGNEFNYPLNQVSEVGLLVRASGETLNQIYDNDFVDCRYAFIAYDDNRSSDIDFGLKLECNNFIGNSTDIRVEPIDPQQPGWGISANQGSAQLSAGNQFNTAQVYKIDNYLDNITYFKSNSENIEANEVDGSVVLVLVSDDNQCESNLVKSKDQKKLAALESKAQAETTRNQLNVLVDGGDTDALTMDVITADYSEAVDLYYELMAKSPSLSVKVMEEAIEKEYELPPALLTMILQSNPTAAKSSKLQDKLDNRLIPLSEYQRYMIDQGKNLISEKEFLEALLSEQELKFESQINQAVNLIMFDDDIEDKPAAVADLISGYETIDLSYMLIDQAIARGEHVLAQSLLDNIPNQYDLRDRQYQEWNDYGEVYQILVDAETSGAPVLSASQISELEYVADKKSNSAAGLAAQVLEQYNAAYVLEGFIVPGENTKSAQRQFKKEDFKKYREIKVYPNPVDKMLVLELGNDHAELKLIVVNANGDQVHQQLVQAGELQLLLPTSKWAVGSYNLMLMEDRNIIHQEKVVVQR